MVTNNTFKACIERSKIPFCQQHPGYGLHSKAFGLGILLHVQQNDPGAFSKRQYCTIENFQEKSKYADLVLLISYPSILYRIVTGAPIRITGASTEATRNPGLLPDRATVYSQQLPQFIHLAMGLSPELLLPSQRQTSYTQITFSRVFHSTAQVDSQSLES